jgi:hypothetical protein
LLKTTHIRSGKHGSMGRAVELTFFAVLDEGKERKLVTLPERHGYPISQLVREALMSWGWKGEIERSKESSTT